MQPAFSEARVKEMVTYHSLGEDLEASKTSVSGDGNKYWWKVGECGGRFCSNGHVQTRTSLLGVAVQ